MYNLIFKVMKKTKLEVIKDVAFKKISHNIKTY